MSKVLTQYYPLAGCFKDNSVDCNDEGVIPGSSSWMQTLTNHPRAKS